MLYLSMSARASLAPNPALTRGSDGLPRKASCMTKRRPNQPPAHFERRHVESPQQQTELDPYEEDDAITLPWLPLSERESSSRQ